MAKTLRNILAGTALLGALTGCSRDQQYISGQVTKENGTAVNIVKSSGALFGNESIKFGSPTYILKVQTDSGEYIINVNDSCYYPTRKPILALAEAIKVGQSRIEFPRRSLFSTGLNYFSQDKIGDVPSCEIRVLK